MKKFVALILALIMTACLPSAALAAGKAAITQEAFYVTPFLSYFAGEVYCEVTNTGDKPVEVDSGVYEFYNADGDSIDSGSIYYVSPRTLLPGEKGYIVIQNGIDGTTKTEDIDDYSVSIVGKSAKEEEVVRYTVSDVSMGAYDDYGMFQAFFATVKNESTEKAKELRTVFAAYDAEGTLLYACASSTSGMYLLPGNAVEVYCTIDGDILDILEAEGKTIATITATAFAE